MKQVQIQIERNAPPPTVLKRGRPSIYSAQLAQLNIGDALIVNNVTDGRVAGIRARCTQLTRTSGARFVTRRLDGQTLKVWRV